MNGVRRATVVAAMALTITLSSTACGAGQSGTVVGHWVLPTTQAWTETTPLGDPWTAAYTYGGMEIQVAGNFSDDPSAQAAMSRLDLPATLRLNDYRPQQTDMVTIPDAYGNSWVRRYTYTSDGKPMQGVWIVAGQWPYPATAAISINAEKIDSAAVEQLVKDLRFVTDQKTGPNPNTRTTNTQTVTG